MDGAKRNKAGAGTGHRDDGEDPYLRGRLLVAMPQMPDRRFAQSVICLCMHNAEGAMGLVLNRVVESISYCDLLNQLGIAPTSLALRLRVHFGGPVEPTRGFVLHSSDWMMEEGSLLVSEGVVLTSTTDVLRSIIENRGPHHSILTLGYTSWNAGQLDAELQANAWLHVDADEALLFDDDIDTKWQRAIAKIGINLHQLSAEAGHA